VCPAHFEAATARSTLIVPEIRRLVPPCDRGYSFCSVKIPPKSLSNARVSSKDAGAILAQTHQAFLPFSCGVERRIFQVFDLDCTFRGQADQGLVANEGSKGESESGGFLFGLNLPSSNCQSRFRVRKVGKKANAPDFGFNSRASRTRVVLVRQLSKSLPTSFVELE